MNRWTSGDERLGTGLRDIAASGIWKQTGTRFKARITTIYQRIRCEWLILKTNTSSFSQRCAAVLRALRDFRRRITPPALRKDAKDGAPHFGNIAKIIKSETKGGPPVTHQIQETNATHSIEFQAHLGNGRTTFLKNSRL